MKHRYWLQLLLVLILLLTVSCSKKTISREKSADLAEQVSPSVERALVERPAAPAALPESPMAGKVGEEAWGEVTQRMIIRTVNMSVIVQDTDATLDLVRNLAKQYNGYIAEANRWLVDDQPFASVTLRIPAEHLDEALSAVRDSAIRVENESSSGQDVTEEYIDLDARIRNLEAAEEELRALLTEVRKNRGKAEDILAIYRELTEIRGQIDTLKGRAQYLQRMSAMATINLTIRPKEVPPQIVEKARWNPLVTLNNALRGFVRVLQGLTDLLIYVLIFSPFVLVPIAILWLLIRWIQKRRKRKQA